jgi:hypothetical protein
MQIFRSEKLINENVTYVLIYWDYLFYMQCNQVHRLNSLLIHFLVIGSRVCLFG